MLKENWKDQRIAAINRISIRHGIASDDMNPYYEEYCRVCNSKAKSKKRYKYLERK
jgi:hypothetical protein